MLPSVVPRLATDSAVRVLPHVWNLLAFLRLPSQDRGREVSLVAQRLKHLPSMQENWIAGRLIPGSGRLPWRRKWQPTPVFLPGESHGQRSLVGYTVHGVTKSRTRLSDFTFTFLGQSSVPISFVSLFVFYVFSYLLSKRMGCFSGCLMSSASIQKLFCGIYSAFKCFFFDEFMGDKVVSLSYSSTILGPPCIIFNS